ncbi:MAG: single-stranded DNA-binding protein [Myxococcales bacterium]|nr:single-stranded DNA-binding protein [Myxococcales bacterium]
MPQFGLNRVLLIGHIASEPRFKLTPERRLPRLWFRVRTEERYHDPEGRELMRKGFHSVVVWGTHAQALHAFLREGLAVAVDGRLATRPYDAGGHKRYETEIVATSVVVLTPRDAQQSAA